MKNKLMIILPHCSTGGMPSYVLKYIELHKDVYDITVIECSFYGWQYVVQREKIQSLVRFISLDDNKHFLLTQIKEIKPDIIWFQELPESFLENDLLKEVYGINRTYFIKVTSHSSYTKRNDFRFVPDEIVSVNKWQERLFQKSLNSSFCPEIDLWEYPIEKKEECTYGCRKIIQEELDFPIEYKNHILNVGLFTPNKNQGELFEIARKNPQNAYHFVGNQAENFKDYWEPLMKNKPDNCIIWGERNDVELFYQACDEMIYVSKLELNPICIKEALSYDLPVKMYKLPTYLDDYDNEPLVTYLKKESVFNINYVNGCFLEILEGDDEYEVLFINNDNEELVYKTILRQGEWGKANYQYFINWRVEVRKSGELIKSDLLTLKDKRVLINFESSSLGDTLAWFPYVEEFRKKHNCYIIVSTFLNQLFKDTYSEIEFVEPKNIIRNIHAQYNLGWFYKGEEIDFNRNPIDPKKYPLQKTACDILGLEYKEIKPKLNLPEVLKDEDKTVTIGFHATNQQKYWNNPDGWQEIFEYFKSIKRLPHIVSIEGNGYMENYYPEDIRYAESHSKTTLNKTIEYICASELFIGIGSGLSWLAWACNVPVILISGFSEEYTEMKDCIRIGAPENVCKGCFNTHKLDAGDWNFCPLKKDFECSKSITSDRVIEAINQVLFK